MKLFLRVWNELDLQDIEKSLIVMGEISAGCFSCNEVGIDVRAKQCPNCGIYFRYIGFRRKIDISYLRKLKEETPYLIFIDFDDFKKAIGKREARKLLDI